MDPDLTLALCRGDADPSVDRRLQRNIAGFDISQNPGLTATLYNLGNAAARAASSRPRTTRRKAKGQPPLFPQENFYGWLVNEKAAELRKLL